MAGAKHQSVATAWPAVCLGLIALLWGAWLSFALYRYGVMREQDVWFQADAGPNLRMFVEGRTGLSIRHPLLGLLTAPLVASAAGVAEWFGVGLGAVPVRDAIALMLVPVAAALRAIVVFKVFERVIGRRFPAVMMTVVDTFSAGAVAGGVVPESFALSALCIAAMFWLFVFQSDEPRRSRQAIWVALAVAAVGITSTNVIPLAILYAGTLQRSGHDRRSIARATVTLTAIALSANVLLALAIAGFYHRPLSPSHAAQATVPFIHAPDGRVLRNIAWAFGHTLVAPRPRMAKTWADESLNPRFRFLFSYDNARHGVGGICRAGLMLALCGLGTLGWWRKRQRGLVAVAGLIVMANAAINLFFGHEFILFALHWQIAMLVLVAGAAVCRWGPIPGDLLISGLAALTVLNSIWLVHWMLAQLAAVPPAA